MGAIMALKFVRTKTAEYRLDFDNGLLIRNPVGVPAGEPEAWPVADLRLDKESIPFKLLGDIEVGKPLQVLLDIRKDGILTVRSTTPVVSID